MFLQFAYLWTPHMHTIWCSILCYQVQCMLNTANSTDCMYEQAVCILYVWMDTSEYKSNMQYDRLWIERNARNHLITYYEMQNHVRLCVTGICIIWFSIYNYIVEICGIRLFFYKSYYQQCSVSYYNVSSKLKASARVFSQLAILNSNLLVKTGYNINFILFCMGSQELYK